MTSKSCLAIFISHFSNNWGIYLFITEFPSFMKEVLKFDIKSVRYFLNCPINNYKIDLKKYFFIERPNVFDSILCLLGFHQHFKFNG